MVRRYVQGLQDWIVGSLHWSFMTYRYFGTDGAEVKKHRTIKLLPLQTPEEQTAASKMLSDQEKEAIILAPVVPKVNKVTDEDATAVYFLILCWICCLFLILFTPLSTLFLSSSPLFLVRSSCVATHEKRSRQTHRRRTSVLTNSSSNRRAASDFIFQNRYWGLASFGIMALFAVAAVH
jgi:hypothetical protein